MHMNMGMEKSNKVVRVTKTEVELSDGQVIPHIVELDEVPTVEQMQGYRDYWAGVLNDHVRAAQHQASRKASRR